MYSRPASRAAQHHRLEVVLAVGLGRVHVQVAAQIGRLRSARAGAARRRRRFRRGARAAPAAPTRGRALRRCLPRCRRRACASSAARNSPYSLSCMPRSSARSRKRDVVRLRAGEVLQRRAAAFGRHEPQVGLVAAADRARWTSSRHVRARARRAGTAVNVVHHARAPAPIARMSMSPQVSVPRRRLPTDSKSTPGAWPARCSTSCAGRVGGVGKQVAIGVLLALLERAQQQLLLPRAHALQLAQAARPWPPPRDRRATRSGARRRGARRSSGRRPAAAAGRAASAGSARSAPGRSRRCRVWQISRMRAERSLPMPGHSRSRLGVEAGDRLGSVGDDVGAVAIRADLEGFSPFSSSRSAISPRMRAIGEIIERRHRPQVRRFRCGSRAGGRRRRRAPRARPRAFVGRREAEQAAAAAGAADLGGLRAGRDGARDQVVDLRRASRPAPAACGCSTPPRGGAPVAVPVAAFERRRASPPRCRECARSSRRRARSPSMWRFMISQLLVPELRGAPV